MDAGRPWLASYPQGVPAEIDLEQYRNIVSVLEDSCERFRDRPAFENMGKLISYDELDRLSYQFACHLLLDLKLARGDRLAIMMPNLLQYPVALFGALRAGLTVVNANPLYTARELRHQLNDSGAVAIVVLENFAHVFAEVAADTQVRHVLTTAVGDMLGFPKGALVNFVLRHVRKAVPRYSLPQAVDFCAAVTRSAGRVLPDVDIEPSDIAFLQYTGGTTGVSKGAMLTHRNLVANMQQASAWLGARVRPGEEEIITALPLYHIFALTANCLVFMKFGGLNHLITNPRDMAGFVKILSGIRFTAITGVNTLFNGLLNTPGFDRLDFSRLHLTLGGGMAVQRAVAERWKDTTGVALREAYGLTETSPAACINPMDLADFNGAIGLPVPSTECAILDEDGGRVAPGDIGELCVRGPQVMAGYWGREADTRAAISDDGWFRTGDMARMDERGFFFVVDRKKDMINVSGFNVYPNEIEDVVAAHPGVLEVAAIGVPDDKSGEAVKVILVKKDPALTAQDIEQHCREQLTAYKRPRHIEFRSELPKSNVGKILRRELRQAV